MTEYEDKRDKLMTDVLDLLKTEPLANIDIRIRLKQEKGHDERTAQYRRVDRAIQNLRKDGLIQFNKGKWYLTSLKKCEHCDGKGYIDTPENNEVDGTPAPS